MPPIPPRRVRKIFAESGGTCAFPDCTSTPRTTDEAPLLQVATISSAVPGGPRFDPILSADDTYRYENLILVCAKHHRIIDHEVREFPATVLRRLRTEQLGRVSGPLSGHSAAEMQSPIADRPSTANRFRAGLKVWLDQRSNTSEEFWQKFFTRKPELLSLLAPVGNFSLNSKCYLGGKSLENSGGSIVDFLAQHGSNCTIIEIKSPATPLLGTKYRANAYPISADLAGGIAQVLNYRATMMSNSHALQVQSPGLAIHNPMALVLVGDIEKEGLNHEQRRSLELFRRSLQGVEIVSYDELFQKVQHIADMLDSAG